MPVIDVQPMSVAAIPGDNVTFTVVVSGGGSISYQWVYLTENSLISGATDATLVIFNVTAEDKGDYLVIVSNEEGTTQSEVASISVGKLSPSNDAKAVHQKLNVLVQCASILREHSLLNPFWNACII